MYIRADHDYGTHWLAEPDLEKNIMKQVSICEYDGTTILEYPEFIILGINNSTSQMTDEATDQAIAIAEKGSPLLLSLMCHMIPLWIVLLIRHHGTPGRTEIYAGDPVQAMFPEKKCRNG